MSFFLSSVISKIQIFEHFIVETGGMASISSMFNALPYGYESKAYNPGTLIPSFVSFVGQKKTSFGQQSPYHLPLCISPFRKPQLLNLLGQALRTFHEVFHLYLWGSCGPADSIRSSAFLTYLDILGSPAYSALVPLSKASCTALDQSSVTEDCTSSLGVQHRAMALVVIR